MFQQQSQVYKYTWICLIQDPQIVNNTYWLVVSTPLKNMSSSVGKDYPIYYGKIKNAWKHQSDIDDLVMVYHDMYQTLIDSGKNSKKSVGLETPHRLHRLTDWEFLAEMDIDILSLKDSYGNKDSLMGTCDLTWPDRRWLAVSSGKPCKTQQISQVLCRLSQICIDMYRFITLCHMEIYGVSWPFGWRLFPVGDTTHKEISWW